VIFDYFGVFCDDMMDYMVSARHPEYRFQGAVGFGGKLNFDGHRLYVTCYREDETPERLKDIDAANAKLGELTPAFIAIRRAPRKEAVKP
jgi:hypothetical protein